MCIWISKYYFIFSFLHDTHIGVSMYIIVFFSIFFVKFKKSFETILSLYIYNKVDSTPSIFFVKFKKSFETILFLYI